MSLASLNRYAIAAAAALTAQVATAAPPHGGGGHAPAAHGHVGPAPVAHNHGHVGTGYYGGYRPVPYSGGYGGYNSFGAYRGVGIGIGFGSGYGLYGPLNYGLGGSPFGYGGLGYGGLGYGALGYGYGVPSTRAVVGVPATTVVTGSSPLPYTYGSPLPSITSLQPSGDPVPQPLPTPAGSAAAEPAVITVITSEGATVSFDGLASEQTGTRHSFTTKPLPSGAQTRVSIKVTGADGRPSTVTLGVAGGEKATVDMRN